MRRASFRSAAVLSSLALVAGLTVGLTSGASAATGQPASSGGALRLKVMSLNMFYGGDDLDTSTGGFCAVPNGCTDNLRRIEQMILATGADVVGTQEAERNDSRMARAMGWYASDRAHVISRYPIIDPRTATASTCSSRPRRAEWSRSRTCTCPRTRTDPSSSGMAALPRS